MSEQEQENIEERLEYWAGEREAIQRSIDALEARLQEIEECEEELRNCLDAAESPSEWEEAAWASLDRSAVLNGTSPV